MSNQDKDVTACVSVRQMCEALGLDPKAQLEKLADPERTPWVVADLATSPRKESEQ